MPGVAGGTPTSVSGHPHLSHHHHLRSLSQRSSSSNSGPSAVSSFADNTAAGSSPSVASTHLESETFRRRSSGNASNTIDTPQSCVGDGGGAGTVSSEGDSETTAATTPATGSRAGHHHYHQTQPGGHHYNRHHHHHHQQANGYQEAMQQHVDSNQQHLSSDYKPNAPHIQGRWNTTLILGLFGKMQDLENSYYFVGVVCCNLKRKSLVRCVSRMEIVDS